MQEIKLLKFLNFFGLFQVGQPK